MIGRKSYLVLFLFLLALIFGLLHLKTIGRIFYPIRYQKEIFEYSSQYEIDPYLVAAVINIESGFRPGVISRKGAVGLMQIMPSTGRWISEELDLENFSVEQLEDPELNIQMGTYYLSHLNDKFQGNMVQILAAYNGGLGNVQKWIDEELWDGEQFKLEQIPFRETRDYVNKVRTVYERYRWLYDDNESPYRWLYDVNESHLQPVFQRLTHLFLNP